MFDDTIQEKIHGLVEDRLKGFKQYIDDALETGLKKLEIRLERRFAAMLTNDASAQEKALVAGGITAHIMPPPTEGAK